MTGTTSRKVEGWDERGSSTPAYATGEQPPTPVAARNRKPERPRVGWIAATAIALMLLLGAGWEAWRWLLLLITMD